MSTKLRGGKESELTRFKRLWLEPSFESSREFWREQFSSEQKQAEIRALLKKRVSINLQWNRQLTEFTQWLERQDQLEQEESAKLQDQAEIEKKFGADWTLDQVREEVLRRSYARAIATGDFASGRKTIVQDLNVKKVALDERKLALLEKKAAAFDQAKEVIESKLSPEEQKKRLKEILK
jgi:hypothetical protein